jgi:hypothetical protein
MTRRRSVMFEIDDLEAFAEATDILADDNMIGLEDSDLPDEKSL